MIKHTPNNFDIVCDLRRCIYSSLTDKGFSDLNFLTFWKLAKKNLEAIKKSMGKESFGNIQKELNLAASNDLLPDQRRERILNASVILQSL